MPELKDCKLITFEEYNELDNPEFIGQTTVKDNIYYMVWKSNGTLYKTKNHLMPPELFKLQEDETIEI